MQMSNQTAFAVCIPNLEAVASNIVTLTSLVDIIDQVVVFSECACGIPVHV